MSSGEAEWAFRLRHMREAAERAVVFAGSKSPKQLTDDLLTQHAVVWNLATIGEAARHVPDDICGRHPEIPWKAIRGFRNRVVHGYDTVDVEVIHAVVVGELPPLIGRLRDLERLYGTS